MANRPVLALLLVAAMGAADAQPAGITGEMLRLAERCGESFFRDIYKGEQAAVACKQGVPNAKGCGEFMTWTSTRNASMANGMCIERFYPKIAWRNSPVNGKYLEGYSPEESKIFSWLAAVSDCKAGQLAKQALDANPDDLALRKTLNIFLTPGWPPSFKCLAVKSKAAPAR